MHAQRAALIVIGHGLDHAAKDIGVDLLPVQRASVQQVGARHAGKARHLWCTGKQATVDVGKGIGPAGQAGQVVAAIRMAQIHGAEDVCQHRMRVAAVALAHLLHGLGKQAVSAENPRVFGKKAEDELSHEVVHVSAAVFTSPIRVLAQQLQVQLVQATRGAHIDRVVLDFLNGGNARQRQEKAEMVGKLRVGAGNGVAFQQVFCFQRLAIGSQDVAGLAPGRGRAAT